MDSGNGDVDFIKDNDFPAMDFIKEQSLLPQTGGTAEEADGTVGAAAELGSAEGYGNTTGSCAPAAGTAGTHDWINDGTTGQQEPPSTAAPVVQSTGSSYADNGKEGSSYAVTK